MKKLLRNFCGIGTALAITTMSICPTFANQKIWGDVSQDGRLTALDASLILEHILNGGILNNEQVELGKVSGDALNLTVNDASLVLRKVLDSKNLFPVENGSNSSESTEVNTESSSEVSSEVNTENSSESSESTETTTVKATISLADGNSTFEGDGVTIDGDTIKLTKAGEYTLSGSLSNGQVIVDSEDDVEVILKGVDITSSTGSPLYSVNGDMDLKLQKGTTNTLTDPSVYTDIDADSEPDACLFSKDRITIKGAGSLIINANASDGIASKDELKIKNGNITVNAVDDGVRAKDYIEIMGSTLNITSQANGIKCTKGYITIDESEKSVDLTVNATNNGIKAETYLQIDSGKVNVTCSNNAIASSTGDLTINGGTITCTAKGTDTTNYNYDGIKASEGSVIINGGDITTDVSCDSVQGALNVLVANGTLNLTSGDNAIASDGEVNVEGGEVTINAVGKGVKAETYLNIKNGTLNIISTDDCIHSNGNVTIDGGYITAQTDDDGVHADCKLTINDGNIDVTKSYEGIEGVYLTVNGGNINIVSSDDGFNANGGNDNSGMGGNDKNDHWGRPGSNTTTTTTEETTETTTEENPDFDMSETPYIKIYNGNIFVNASGDGIDSNADTFFYGGTVVVDGPSNGGNGALDCGDNNNKITFDGGLLLAIGSSGMDEAPTVSNTNAYGLKYNTSVSANTLLSICDSDGNVIATYKTKKSIQSIVFASEKLEANSTYTIYSGGTYSGTLDENGFATGGTLTSGTVLGTVTISSSSVTTGNSSSNNGNRYF